MTKWRVTKEYLDTCNTKIIADFHNEADANDYARRMNESDCEEFYVDKLEGL